MWSHWLRRVRLAGGGWPPSTAGLPMWSSCPVVHHHSRTGAHQLTGVWGLSFSPESAPILCIGVPAAAPPGPDSSAYRLRCAAVLTLCIAHGRPPCVCWLPVQTRGRAQLHGAASRYAPRAGQRSPASRMEASGEGPTGEPASEVKISAVLALEAATAAASRSTRGAAMRGPRAQC
jgi:hypothetical protein